MKRLCTLTDKDVTGKVPKEPKTYFLREAGRAIVFNSEKKIALLHAVKYGFHKLPGGGVKQGEDIKKALERELLEEIGCRVTITQEIGFIIELKKELGQKQTSYCYIGEVVTIGQNRLTPEEKKILGIEVVWVTLRDALTLMKNDKPEDYTAQFIRARDLLFLEEVRKRREVT